MSRNVLVQLVADSRSMLRLSIAIVGCLLVIATGAAAAEAPVAALLIGVDRYQHFPPLHGASNDAQDIGAAIQARGGSVIALIDREATRQTVIESWRSLVKSSPENGVLVLAFSGYGWREPVPDAKEGSTPRNVLLLGGFQPQNENSAERIVDSELTDLFAEAGKRTVIFLADTCYAPPDSPSSDSLSNSLRYRSAAPEAIEADALHPPLPSPAVHKHPETLVRIAAVSPSECFREIVIDGQVRGALSWSFARAISRRSESGDYAPLTLGQLANAVRENTRMITQDHQLPEISLPQAPTRGFSDILSTGTQLFGQVSHVQQTITQTQNTPKPSLQSSAPSGQSSPNGIQQSLAQPKPALVPIPAQTAATTGQPSTGLSASSSTAAPVAVAVIPSAVAQPSSGLSGASAPVPSSQAAVTPPTVAPQTATAPPPATLPTAANNAPATTAAPPQTHVAASPAAVPSESESSVLPMSVKGTDSSKTALAWTWLNSLNGVKAVKDSSGAFLVWDTDRHVIFNALGDRVAPLSGPPTQAELQGIVNKWRTVRLLQHLAMHSGLHVEVQPRKILYHAGDHTRITLTSSFAGYWTLFDLAPDGKVALLGSAGGGTADKTFSTVLISGPPYGADHLVAIVSAERIDSIAQFLRAMSRTSLAPETFEPIVQQMAKAKAEFAVVGTYSDK